ncbi:uncharacterized protein LOC108088826 isoform X1 [Drosophila ficusphila]|uniref:uncharacterized protein LOC108088826 isoform X1 n=1 Tax=Drosophila ficusphila TaxID=30025 RepID=UPI0007E61066|nr:uncharacterized protein LOC108088826 isoform X1 [Drosophila ficusphila]
MPSKGFPLRRDILGVVLGLLCIATSICGALICSVYLGDIRPSDTLILTIGVSIFLFLLVANILTSIVLFVGILKKRSYLVLPWLIDNGLLLILLSIISLLGWISVIANSTRSLYILLFTIIVGMLNVLFWYLYYGIYSLYKTFQASEKLSTLYSTLFPASQPHVAEVNELGAGEFVPMVSLENSGLPIREAD